MVGYLMRPLYYDRQGKPLTMQQWVARYESKNPGDWERKHRVAITEWGRVKVSTVWLGIDHAFGSGPPLIFETMVFLDGTSRDEDMARYSTEQQALAGHHAMVDLWRHDPELAASEGCDDDEPSPRF